MCVAAAKGHRLFACAALVPRTPPAVPHVPKASQAVVPSCLHAPSGWWACQHSSAHRALLREDLSGVEGPRRVSTCVLLLRRSQLALYAYYLLTAGALRALSPPLALMTAQETGLAGAFRSAHQVLLLQPPVRPTVTEHAGPHTAEPG